MKRFWIILVAVAMAMVAAIPAGAAKPDKPAKPSPALFDVTFEFVNANDGFSGFSTKNEQCTTGGSITMEAGPGGRLMATGDGNTDVPLLDVRLDALGWYRYYPYYAQASEVPDDFDPNDYPLEPLEDPPLVSDLTGCHGAGIEVLVSQADDGTKTRISVEDYPRFLMLTIRDGFVDIRWEADYYLEKLETAAKNPRKDPNVSASAMEGFSYSGSNLVWDKASGLVTGWIDVSHFSPGVYDPFNGSPVKVDFNMTIEEHGTTSE